MAYRIIKEKCIGCGACAWACLFGVPKKTNDNEPIFEIAKEKCAGCGHCINLCPNNAIEPLPDHKTLKKVTIIAENCKGCTVCARICPEKAPFGERGKPFSIDESKCILCGACAMHCRFEAINAQYAN